MACDGTQGNETSNHRNCQTNRVRAAGGRVAVAAILAFGVLCFSATQPRAAGSGIIIYDHHKPFRPEIRPPHHVRPIEAWSPFGVKSEQVNISIDDARAETSVEQVFVNRSGAPVEGTYLFPMAEDAAVHRLSMWMNGREVQGELLDADKARHIYQSIVSAMRDPALLQYVGRGLFQAKVFPIPPGGECRIKLSFTQAIQRDGGLGRYRFPLANIGAPTQPVERLAVRAEIRSARPLTHVFSPSHSCSIDRRGEKEAVVGFERTGAPADADFHLYFGGGDQEFGLALLTHRVPGEDGFFMARISPASGASSEDVLPKNICFVLDTSGSMADDNKIGQAKKALKFCVTNLGAEERFQIVTFSTEVRAFREEWCAADEDGKTAARAYIDRLNAVGGTDIDGALSKAIAMRPPSCRCAPGAPEHRLHKHWANNPYLIVFITDGEPTVGVTDPQQILARAQKANTGQSARIHVLGVGYQVNAKLLDRLADENGGARDYVTPSEDLELKLSSFYTKLASPVLTALRIAVKGVTVDGVYPVQLPDLFKGGELVVYGRYASRGSEESFVELTGTRRGEPVTYRYDASFPAEHGCNEFLPRLWAVQKIGYLLDQIRLHGDNRELRDEVVRLSTRYGIMTPYTSFLVQEDQRMARADGRPAAAPLPPTVNHVFGRQRQALDEAKKGFTAAAGEAAIRSSLAARDMQAPGSWGADLELARMVDFAGREGNRRVMQHVGARTFYQDGARWVDSLYDGKTKPEQLTAYSEEYFRLAARRPEIAQYLSQGDQVLVVLDGKPYEIVQPPPSRS